MGMVDHSDRLRLRTHGPLVPGERLGLDLVADRFVGRRHLLHEIRLATGSERDLAPDKIVRRVLCELDSRARPGRGFVPSAPGGSGRQIQGVWGRQHIDAAFATAAGRTAACNHALRPSPDNTLAQMDFRACPRPSRRLGSGPALEGPALHRRGQGIVDVILKPLHPLGVWLVATLAANAAEQHAATRDQHRRFSELPSKKQDNNDDQQDADEAVAAVTEAISRPADTATDTPEQENEFQAS